ncbi:hypothetical protein [Litorisediminicola beolgyonensis]|uniref:Uncharacterized protein n=1 Tax=Litorisediminicola beolgyonensis TaxID=1173614 RepID=A0ABW3ZDF7_9RHOB
MNQDERRIATFTLAGSKAALLKLMDCGRSIAPDDPFTSRADPF